MPTVHVVAKTHLDLGFTALAAEVEARYLVDLFPRALEVAAELRTAGGPERLTWTTGSWILTRALDPSAPAGSAELADRVAAGIAAGDLAWHALPVTTHTELMDARLVRSGLSVSRDLDRRFGRSTTAAKMTDVPGHTRGLVPLLAEAGVTFLHIGVNPAWPVPDVPSVFRWRSPDGAEVVVAYQAGGYGGEVVVPGCDHVLAFLHAGDNQGPPTADEVRAAHAGLRARHPGADVVASTLDAFARGLAACPGAVAALPVVTAEIGDPWLFGAGSDPSKLAAFRALLRSHERSAADDARLLLVTEHTWGLDTKLGLAEDPRWDRVGLAELRTSDVGRRVEASWDEQRAYLGAALEEERISVPRWPMVDGTPPGSWTAIDLTVPIQSDTLELTLGPTGAVVGLVHHPTGRIVADADHPLGSVTYQSFDESDYERFYAGLVVPPEDRWWARLDNTKPGIDAHGAVSATWEPTVTGAWRTFHQDGAWHDVLVRTTFAGPPVTHLGAPDVVWLRWFWPNDLASGSTAVDLELTVWWEDKPASRLPEAIWCSFVPHVAEPDRWLLDKLGQWVSPLDVVRHGGRALHGVGNRGLAYDGPDGPLRLRTDQAPLVAPGRPRLLDADPPVPDLTGGFHVLLADNCWGTNFPMWIEGPARFRFELEIG